MAHTVIIGNGISGITTARHIRKNSSEARITVISSETKYFYSRTALMYIYMGHMRMEDTQPYENGFWKKNRIDLIQNRVEKIDFDNKKLVFTDNTELSYDKLVLALGSKSNKFGWPGQDLKGVQGLFSFQDLENMEKYTKNIQRAVIVGGGLIGVEMAEMLLSRNIPVTFLVRETKFWGNVLPQEEGDMIKRHMTNDHHVDLRLETGLKEIISDENGRVKAIVTTTGETIECGFVGLTAGVSPNIDFVKDSSLETNRGILVDRFLETNIKDVYSLGDCAEFREPVEGRRPLEQVWYTGRIMGEALGKTLTGKPAQYAPGVWFNSAKFFDIEYQTYGWVFPQLKENESTFYWEDKTGKICLRINYLTKEKTIIGINNFGIRLRHEVCDRWFREQRTIEYALEHLKDANFDPEFYKQYENDIVKKFNQENGTSISVKKRSWARIFQTKLKTATTILLLLLSYLGVSQPLVDGFSKGKGNLDLVSSYTFDSYSRFYAKPGLIDLGRQTNIVSLYSAIGLTDKWSLQANIPFISSGSEFAVQDATLLSKIAFFSKTIQKGKVSVLTSNGFSTPLSKYETETLFALGQRATSIDNRLIVQYTGHQGFFAMAQTGYTYRIDPSVSSIPIAIKIGLAKEKNYFDLWIDIQKGEKGRSYRDNIMPKPSFREFSVSYLKIGGGFYHAFSKKTGLAFNVSNVINGENLGKSITTSISFIYKIKYRKKSIQKD